MPSGPEQLLSHRSGYGRGGRCYFRYVAGDWDAAATLAAAVDQHVAALAPQLAADALAVEVGRGEATVEERLASLTQQYGTYRAMDIFVALGEAEQALWRDELERASLRASKWQPTAVRSCISQVEPDRRGRS